MNRGRSTVHVWAHIGTDHCPRCFCLRFSFRCSRHVARCSSPEESWPFLAKPRGHLYPLAAGLLEPVPFERAYTSEELVVRLTVLLGLVLDQGKFDSTEVIEPLARGGSRSSRSCGVGRPLLRGPCPPSRLARGTEGAHPRDLRRPVLRDGGLHHRAGPFPKRSVEPKC